MGAELAEQRAELRWQEGRSEGIHIGEEKGRAEGIQIGEERGKVEGRIEGLEEGEERGRAGLRDGILMVLRSRGVGIPSEIEAQILACKDVAVLSAWLQRAVTLADAGELTSAVNDRAAAS